MKNERLHEPHTAYKKGFVLDCKGVLKNTIKVFVGQGEDMANYAYLRVSTDQQDVDNQRHGILEYANRNGISSIQFVEDTVSGKVKWRDRRIGDLLLKTMQPGDTAVFAEISRMARSRVNLHKRHQSSIGFWG